MSSETQNTDHPTRRFSGSGLSRRRRGIQKPEDAMKSAAQAAQPVRVDRRERTDPSEEQAPLGKMLPVVSQQIVDDRQRTLELLNAQVELVEATKEDIPIIQAIYEQLYLDREAFRTITSFDSSAFRRAMKERGSEDHQRLAAAVKEISGGGEFSHITDEEWLERIAHPGKRVQLIRLVGSNEVVGVNSYCIGEAAAEIIRERFDKIQLNSDGQGWINNRIKRYPKAPLQHIIMIDDTFFGPGQQGKGLFKKTYQAMLEFELGMSGDRAVMTEENQLDWAIWYFVNRFEEVWAEDRDHVNISDFLTIQQNNHTIRAGGKFGARQIGITRSIDLSTRPIKVPSLEGEGIDWETTADGATIWVKKGYADMLILVPEMNLHA